MHFSHVVESPRALLEWNTKHHKWRESNWICLYPTACLWFYPPGEDIIRTMISRETAKSFSSFADRMHCASCSATAHTSSVIQQKTHPLWSSQIFSLIGHPCCVWCNWSAVPDSWLLPRSLTLSEGLHLAMNKAIMSCLTTALVHELVKIAMHSSN